MYKVLKVFGISIQSKIITLNNWKPLRVNCLILNIGIRLFKMRSKPYQTIRRDKRQITRLKRANKADWNRRRRCKLVKILQNLQNSRLSIIQNGVSNLIEMSYSKRLIKRLSSQLKSQINSNLRWQKKSANLKREPIRNMTRQTTGQ